MAPSAAVADVYLPRGGTLEMPHRPKVCRAFEMIFAARPVRSLRLSLPLPVVLHAAGRGSDLRFLLYGGKGILRKSECVCALEGACF